MADIQHSAIPDAQRHEPKGMTAAQAGEALFCDVTGTSTIFRPIVFADIADTPTFTLTLVEEINSDSTVDQTVTAADTPTQVSFGGAIASSNVSLAADGSLTFLTDGTYLITADVCVGKTGSSAGRMFLLEEVDGTALSAPTVARVSGSSVEMAVTLHSVVEATAGQVYKLWMMGDAGSLGLLSTATPGGPPAGWGANSASAHIHIFSFGS